MKKDWILLTKETRRTFSKATWVPLRAFCNDENGPSTRVGYVCDCFACGSVAFPPEHRERAEKLSWNDIGIGHNVLPYAYEDGYFSSIDQYKYNDKIDVGDLLVFSANMIHRGLYGLDRLSFDIIFCDSDPDLVKYVGHDCLPNDDELKKIECPNAFINTIRLMS